MTRLEELSDGLMKLPPLREQHLPIGDFLEREVAEDVCRLGMGSLERDDARRFDSAQVISGRRRVALTAQEVERDLPFEHAPDDAADLQQQPLRRWEAIETRGDGPLDARRQIHRTQIAGAGRGGGIHPRRSGAGRCRAAPPPPPVTAGGCHPLASIAVPAAGGT